MGGVRRGNEPGAKGRFFGGNGGWFICPFLGI